MNQKTRPLVDLLDRSVQFQGYLDYWEPVPGREQIRYLLKPVKVKPYGSALGCDRHIQHLWFYLPKNTVFSEALCLKELFTSVGVVKAYRRKDDSTDYEIDCSNNFDSHMYFQYIRRNYRCPSEQVRLLQALLDAVTEQRAIVPYDFDEQKLNTFAKEIQAKLKVASHRAEVKERNAALRFVYHVEAGVQRAERYKVQSDPVQFKGKASSAQGFGSSGNTVNTKKCRDN